MSERLRNFSKKRVRYRFASLKMGKLVHAESSLEFDACYHFEYARDIVSFQEQRLKIEYEENGETHSHFPDFVLNGEDKGPIVEVKPSRHRKEDRNRRNFAAGIEYAKRKNMEYIVHTEEDIRREPRLGNLKLLYRYARHVISLDAWFEVKKILSEAGGTMQLNELESLLTSVDNRQRIACIYSLIWRQKHLSIDLEQPITKKTVVALISP